MFSGRGQRRLCSSTRGLVDKKTTGWIENLLTLFLQDNHMINGTKLLNVAGMTRGRRDGILKSEKLRHVVKIGPMHLKGVW